MMHPQIMERIFKAIFRKCFEIQGFWGIERSRARSFRDFIHVYKDFDLYYMTDNDTIHDLIF